MTSGLHHVTGVTADVQANVDFYAGFLGLRLVKQEASTDSGDQLILTYGDAAGSPGSLVSFFVWEAAGRGRVGHGQVSEIAFAVPEASLGTWLTRALDAGRRIEGPKAELGQSTLRLKDPDGLIVKLVATDRPALAPLPDAGAPTRLHSVTLLTERGDETRAFLEQVGYRHSRDVGAITRMRSDSDLVDIRNVSGYVPSIEGAGIPVDVAFRADSAAALEGFRDRLAPDSAAPILDHVYYLGLHLREPGGTAITLATDDPGFGVDEPLEYLGQRLTIHPKDAPRAAELRLLLPQFAQPGAPRRPHRDLPFIHRFHDPDTPDGSTAILLHGTGGNEAELMPMVHAALPHATLLGLRGRATEEDLNRWFRRHSLIAADQDDVTAEARALNAFVEGATTAYGLDPERCVFVGYDNGADMLAAFLQLYPGVARRAVLIRGGQPLDPAPEVDLTGTDVLLLKGKRDPFATTTPALEAALTAAGATLDTRFTGQMRLLSPADTEAIADWANT